MTSRGSISALKALGFDSVRERMKWLNSHRDEILDYLRESKSPMETLKKFRMGRPTLMRLCAEGGADYKAIRHHEGKGKRAPKCAPEPTPITSEGFAIAILDGYAKMKAELASTRLLLDQANTELKYYKSYYEKQAEAKQKEFEEKLKGTIAEAGEGSLSKG